MGNPCSSGNGVPNPGSGAVAFLTNLAVSAFLTRLGLGWLGTVAGALPQFAFDVADFCRDGQPALPTITADDVLALAAPLLNPQAGPAGIKVRDLVLHYLWYELCHCESVSTPSPPAVQSPPDVIGYGSAVDQTTVCLIGEHTSNVWTDPITGHEKAIGLARWGSGAPTATGSDATKTVRRANIKGTKVFGATGTHEDPWTVNVYWTGRSATPIIKTTTYSITGVTVDIWEDAPAGALELRPAFVVNTSNSADSVDGDIDCYCDAVPLARDTECCPPDASALAAIAALQSELDVIKDQVDLIQRQSVPFAYVAGTNHSGLTGDGHIDVADLIGCQLTLQAPFPDWLGFETGDTYEYFTESWINWSVGPRAAPREFIRSGVQLSFPRNAGLYTRISYSLKPGIHLAITELEREP